MPTTKQARRYGDSVSDCTLSFCAHFNEERRLCSLRKCYYDRKDVFDRLDRVAQRLARPDYDKAYNNGFDGNEGYEEWDG